MSLEIHSHYSLYRATPSIEALVGRAAAEGVATLALTDTAALFGALKFKEACSAAGIRPLLGMIAPVAPIHPLEELSFRPDELVLLATNDVGYRSLAALATYYQADPQREFFRRHGLPRERLTLHAAGLIAITGARGVLPRLVTKGDQRAAARYLSRLAPIYGEQLFVGLDVPSELTKPMVELAARFGVLPVAAPPVFVLDPADRPLLRLLAAMDGNVTIADIDEQTLPTADTAAVWRSPEQLAADFADFPEALAHNAAIAARCEWGMPDGRPLWPVLELADEQTADDALATATTVGLLTRFTDPPTTVATRAQKELALITQHGYAPLFLILADVVAFARREKIAVNTRGSVANSLVAYAIGITHVDPIEHDLLFERFLNPERRELPDIDLDFCSRRRDEVLAYIRQKYGEDRVALVSTVNTLQNRSAVREVGKAHGLTSAELKELTEQVPRTWHPDPTRRTAATLHEALAELLAKRPQWEQIIDQATRLVGYPSHLGLHPGGVVISPPPDIIAYAPLHYSPKGYLATQFDFRDVEKIGLVKVDLLGIRALSVIDQAAALIRERHDPEFAIEEIDFADQATGDCLEHGQTIGCFQVESTGAIRTVRQLKARSIRDLAMANAFFKPGPATGGMAAAFIRRYRGEEPASYLHAALEPILQHTKGVLIFQEQVLRIVTEVAGLGWVEANQIRKGISKFRGRQVRALKDRFCAGVQSYSGLSAAQADTLWTQIEAFSGYGFNQGHATSYGLPTYQMAWLKTHFPAEFFGARLAEHGGFHHPAIYIAEARQLGLTVRQPHINHSQRRFALDGVDKNGRPILWMGLGQVRDLRRATVKTIIRERNQGAFGSVADFLERVRPQTKEIDHLIRCGALDGLGEHRRALLAGSTAGSAGRQMSLFAPPEPPTVEAESPAERLAWEEELLGWPMSAHPVDHLQREPADRPLPDIDQTAGAAVQCVGVRLPGHTGGRGYYLNDGRGLILVIDGRQTRPTRWQPVRVIGRWRIDGWSGGWLAADRTIAL